MKGHMIYQAAQGIAMRMIEDRRRHVSEKNFDAVWVSPGYVRIVGKGNRVRLCLCEENFQRSQSDAQERERENASPRESP